MISSDVCVVGAGPAGLTLSLLLLRSGLTVTLVERSALHGREFRGEILQPGGMELLDGLGVLSGAMARGGYPLDRFRLREGRRTLLDIDYRRLEAPYNQLLSIPQQHLLEELLAHCEKLPGFTYLPGHRVGSLQRHEGRTTGLTTRSPDGGTRVNAGCVVGADGRYSKVRQLAGIQAGRLEAFDFDVLWLKVPIGSAGAASGAREVSVVRSRGNPVLVYPSWPDSVQIGWTLPHRSFAGSKDAVFARAREEIVQALPQYADAVRAALESANDLTLLDVFAGCADTWVQDGLVLIGDAAHTHSPLGAQGINLAIQDAALLHPVLTAAVRGGSFAAEHLRAYETGRRPAIDAVMKFQVMQSRMMLARGGLEARLRPVVARIVGRTPIGTKITARIAYGSSPVPLRTDLFTS
ncbi:FAD-dependent monooxygenase [Kitasatospora sp. NPDC001540]|uniref:FAD-dependent monooxygenase n=1 Tax=Kitasatospora sp. NPDC001540 TaxID=3364014 RepID=UPI0036C737E1